jgi:hypothetical protein
MSAKLSVADVLAHMEAQLARHKQQEAHHGEQEVFHRDQKAQHAAEYENVLRHYEAFKATAGAAVEIAARTAAQEPEPANPPELQPGQRIIRSRLVTRVLEELPAGESFGASHLAAEVNRRYGKHLKKPANARLVSAVLRRKLANGELRVIQEGAPHREAVYAKS